MHLDFTLARTVSLHDSRRVLFEGIFLSVVPSIFELKASSGLFEDEAFGRRGSITELTILSSGA